MKQVFLETFGCQMNVADTDRMELILFHSGYRRTQEKEEADLILVNTCSIREKAEQKTFSLFGGLKPLKATNPDLILGLTGCMGQQDGEKMLKRMPFLDFVLGPDQVEGIGKAVNRVRESEKPFVWTGFDSEKIYSIPEISEDLPQKPGPSAFVNIIKGCDKFCTFCIVPFTRGREKSREPEELHQEIRHLIKHGAKEIILLGQNVNSYGKHGLKNSIPFHELLYGIADIPGLQRLRFTTSHPNDFTRETIRAYRDLDVLVNHLHLPIQSGNNEILKTMRRDHTVEEYLELIDELKSEVPDVSLTTDIIVGFPGETDSQFQDTLKVMERVGYSSSFMFSYSPRPGTPANEMQDSVPEDVKKQRLQEIIQLQNRLTEEQGKLYQGKTVEVLIEGNSSRPGYAFKGRNPQYWRVNAKSDTGQFQPGDIVQVKIEQTSGHGLSGVVQ
ncbi:MAG: tRNA (N6-isopentenyl adenosine(37)-C2)-methylthiotransferase MiaB [Nitrospina sp.]|jgi:tRNA-2-methylthio-N6-dimethylallyladenosine synthase|nr:tRNA (N6-isopentenyl adenosine(37)-C2)-methylthiotransferase MiaB [Nitrospina sp.]MBT6716565.1 tRNA (N6-isopentenyl adenosine(37)-C2)-methylthiotransferase MiaB [Nitrospina sp.]